MTQKRYEPYAKALYELALKSNQLEEWLHALDAVNVVFKSHPEVLEIFSSPLISLEQKESAFKKGFGSHLPLELLDFALILLKKGHFDHFPAIFERYKQRVFKKQAMVGGLLSTPYPLAEGLKNELVKKWERILNKKIFLNEKIDESLIGGGILELGDHRIDFSLKGKLQKLKMDLLNK